MRDDVHYTRKQDIFGLVIIITLAVTITLGFLLVGKTEFTLLIVLAVTISSVMLLFADQVFHLEQWKLNSIPVITMIIIAIILAIYLFE